MTFEEESTIPESKESSGKKSTNTEEEIMKLNDDNLDNNEGDVDQRQPLNPYAKSFGNNRRSHDQQEKE